MNTYRSFAKTLSQLLGTNQAVVTSGDTQKRP